LGRIQQGRAADIWNAGCDGAPYGAAGGDEVGQWDWDSIIRKWLIAGGDPEQFWHSTVRLVALVVDAHAIARRDEHNSRVILAYNIAALSRARRLSTSDVERLFMRERRRQTWQESNALMWKWYRAQEARKAAMREHHG
jgi:hypothetical protein